MASATAATAAPTWAWLQRPGSPFSRGFGPKMFPSSRPTSRRISLSRWLSLSRRISGVTREW